MAKRRWYQFSLRTLFIVTTLAGVFLGSRGLDYERKAKYHDEQVARVLRNAARSEGHVILNDTEKGEHNDHEFLAQWYRYAARRPWIVVDESRIIKVPPK